MKVYSNEYFLEIEKGGTIFYEGNLCGGVRYVRFLTKVFVCCIGMHSLKRTDTG